jgi:hypothetical protein
MIDSIGFFVPEASINSDCLSGIKPHMNGEGFRGSLGNLVITQEDRGVYVKGSLPKFLNGENANSLTRQGLREALGKIEAETRLNTHIAQVRQLEIGATLSVEKPPRRYLETWGPVSRYSKDIYGNGKTVTYHTKSRSFSGYDKGAEMTPKALPWPYAGRYCLRLELRYQKGLKPLLGRFLSPWEILEIEHYNDFIERWKQFYFSIPKRRLMFIDMEDVTPKKLERSLASFGLHSYGLDKLNANIIDGQRCGQYSPVNASRMRQLAHELEQDKRFSSAAPLAIEIDEKVQATLSRLEKEKASL